MPSIAAVRQVVELLGGRYQNNFECDTFANKLQQALDRSGISCQGKMLAFRRADRGGDTGIQIESALSSNTKSYHDDNVTIDSSTRAYPKIAMHRLNHPLDGQVIGNQTHFWTEITVDDGQTYCFDNNNPQGVLKHEFYQSLEFRMELFLETDPAPPPGVPISQRDHSARTLFDDETHRFRSNSDILSNKHLIMLDTSVQDFREKLDSLPNWQYHGRRDIPSEFNPKFLKSEILANLTQPPEIQSTTIERNISTGFRQQIQEMRSQTDLDANQDLTAQNTI